jgi:6-phosphogluconate dehydrogenase
MQLGLIGLGRMGGNMRERLRGAGHEVIGYDRNPDVSDVPALDAMVEALAAPRVVWVMVPSGDPTRDTVARLAELLEADDLVIDGGNSRFTDDFENAKLLADKGIGYVDCGVSGGVWGLENGYGLMCGGDDKWVERAMPIFDALRPEGPREEGFVHAGEVGAGHYAKMVHNGIEYGLMHAYAEGYELLEAKDIVTDVVGTFKAWSRGTVVRSWLLDLMVDALEEKPHLKDVSDYTHDSGEGRWTVEEALALGVPMPVISASLFARFASRQETSPAMQAVAALRGQFGGHQVMTIAEGDALREGKVPPEPSKREKVSHDVRSFEAKGDASSRAFEKASQANVDAAQDAVDKGAPPATEPTDQAHTELGTERSKRSKHPD